MAGNAPSSDSPAEIEGVPAPGAIIADKYVVERMLGKGGMGVVLAARHQRLDQPVAIKMLLPKIASHPEAVARFVREAQAAVTIQSNHVARVIDVGSLENNVPFMVMEFLEGTTLAQVLAARGPLPIPIAVTYILEACEALAEAHAKGIIHRDLKPSNLFLADNPDGPRLIKILDFGIAKIVADEREDSVKLTGTGVGMGSPQYMSPEQLRDAGSVDARTDIWSIGITLFELITRKLPFNATTFSALCAQIIADPPIRLREVRPSAPAELEEIIARCLEKPVARRFESVAELAQALLPFADGRSERSVKRISSFLPPRRSFTPAALYEQPDAQRPELDSDALATTVGNPARPSMMVLGVAGSAAALLAAVILLWASHHRSPEPPTSGSSSVNALASASLPASAAPASSITAPSEAPTAPRPIGSAPAAVTAELAPLPEAATSGLQRPSSCPEGRPCRRAPTPPSKRSPGATSAPARGASGRDPLDDRK